MGMFSPDENGWVLEEDAVAREHAAYRRGLEDAQRGLRAIPAGTPIKDGRAWFIIVGASDSACVRGYKVLPGGVVNACEIGAIPRTSWVTPERARELLQAIADGRDVELL